MQEIDHPRIMSSSKEIEVIETQIEQNYFAQNDRIVRKYFQIYCAAVANLMLLCFGIIFPQSGFIIPQLEDPINGFGIDKEEGSWFGKL